MAELPRPLPPPTLSDRFEVLRDWRTRLSPGALIGAIAAVAIVVVGALAAGVLGGGVGHWRAGGADVALSLPKATAASDSKTPAALDTTTTAATTLHVHAAGAVMQPGVVTVPAGSRVTDVVAAAGGPAANADLDQVNLAAPVTDGERVYIPHQGEVGVALNASSSGAATGAEVIVDLNQADETQLETLPGVGPATAQAIIDYRGQHGRFRSVDDLLNVRGIGPSKLDQIKPHARV